MLRRREQYHQIRNDCSMDCMLQYKRIPEGATWHMIWWMLTLVVLFGIIVLLIIIDYIIKKREDRDVKKSKKFSRNNEK